MNNNIERLDPRVLLTTLARERTFGGGGIVRLNYGTTAVIRNAFPKADNMVMVAGGIDDDLLVIRLRANGKRDTTFGSDGRFRYHLTDIEDSVTKIEPSGNGWLLTSASNKQLRITAKGKLDREFGVRPLLRASDLVTRGYSDIQDLGERRGIRYFAAQLSSTARYQLVSLDVSGNDVATVDLESLDLQFGPHDLSWAPESYWVTPKFYITSDSRLALVVAQTSPYSPSVDEDGTAAMHFWNLDGSLDASHARANIATINGSIPQMLRRADGSVVFLQRDGNDNHTRVGLISADGSTFTNLGYLGQIDGPTLQSVYSSFELSGDSKVIARGTENPRLFAGGGGSALTVIDIATGDKQVLRTGPEDRLVSARTTPWGNEAVVYSNQRIALYTPAFANSANQLVTGTISKDTIRINQVGDRLLVNVNGRSHDIAATVYDSFNVDPSNPTDPLFRLPVSVFAGGSNDKVIFEGSAPVVVSGGPGRDTLYGGGGSDILDGDSGDDLIFGRDGDDLIRGGDGVDNEFGGAGADMIYGGAHNDFLDGQEGADSLLGEGGDDILIEYPTGSVDYFYGGDGSDRAYHPESQDILDSVEADFVPLG